MTTAHDESMLLVMAEAIAAVCKDVHRYPGEPAASFITDLFFIAADPADHILEATS